MSDDFTALTGRCMCGAVEISTAAPFIGALYCHCKRCQRRSGTTRSMTALCPPGAFSVAAGEDKVQVWDPGDGWLKAFCVKCGSHTHTVSPDDPTLVAIRLGCLDQDAGIRPQVHQFVAYASSLEPLPDDGLPRFPERFGATDPALSSAKGSSATPPATFAADGAGAEGRRRSHVASRVSKYARSLVLKMSRAPSGSARFSESRIAAVGPAAEELFDASTATAHRVRRSRVRS